MADLYTRALSAGSRDVSGESLAVARIAFGAVGLASAIRLMARGWVSSLLAGPEHHLRYPAMGWVPVPPGWVVHLLVVVIALAAACVMVGFHHRAAAATFWIAFTWVELLEATIYLNHYWFMTLVGASMVVLPMSARWSVDSVRRGPSDVPAAAVWLLRFQVASVYLFAGLAKLNGDWLNGLPLGLWLPARSDLPIIGSLLGTHTAALLASWGGALFDCTVVGFLLWRRTRIVAWIVLVTFHVSTWLLFPVIGVFPWLMIPMSTVLFDPDWPSRVLERLGLRPAVHPQTRPSTAPAGRSAVRPLRTRVVVVAAVLWVALQIALPLRHLAYPGDHRWTGEGLRFGWNVMLIEKAGDVTFRITDPRDRSTWTDDARTIYTPQQWRVMSTDPELIRQAAHQVALEHGATSTAPLEVRADALVSLNGRTSARLIDPDVDLAAEPWRLGAQPWVLPVPEAPRPL